VVRKPPGVGCGRVREKRGGGRGVGRWEVTGEPADAGGGGGWKGSEHCLMVEREDARVLALETGGRCRCGVDGN